MNYIKNLGPRKRKRTHDEEWDEDYYDVEIDYDDDEYEEWYEYEDEEEPEDLEDLYNIY